MGPAVSLFCRGAIFTDADGSTRPMVLVLDGEGRQLLAVETPSVAKFILAVRTSAQAATSLHEQLLAGPPADLKLFQAQPEGRA